MEPAALYTRYEDGNQPVRVEPDPAHKGKTLYLLGDQEPVAFKSARQLLISVTGHPKARNWTFDRYFRTSSSLTLPVQPSLNVFQLLNLDTALTVAPAFHREHGIDLQRRGHEVAKLLFAGFGRQIHAAGFDPDDVLQEVYRGLLARNEGRCPWDKHKSSFGHYVHMVCRCVVSNYGRKQRRIRSIEQVGMSCIEDGERSMQDVATAAKDNKGLSCSGDDVLSGVLVEQDFQNFLLRQRGSNDSVLAVSILPLVHDGHTRTEIAMLMGTTKAAVSRALTYLRRHATTWAEARALPTP